MENKKIWTIITTAVISVQFLLQVLTVIVVLQLNMLPNDYIAVFILTMVLLLEGVALFMFTPVKGVIRLWRRIVSCILAAAIICGCAFVSKVALDARKLVNDLVDGTTAPNYSYVLVLNDNAAHSLEDAKGFRFGEIEDYDQEHTQLVIQDVEQATGETINLTGYPTAMALADALLHKEIDALIMNGASISLLLDQADYQDLMSYVRVLYEKPYEAEKEQENTPIENINKSVFVVYISGSDTRSQLLQVSRSDVNILAVVNPETKQILLLNTPRDYYVPNSAGKGALDKLTHCSNYGVQCSIDALESVYNVEVTHYAQINFTGFEKLIDAIGGITVNSDESFRTFAGTYISKGENALNGKTALEFARERYNVSGGDNGRGKNQMKIIKAVIEKMCSSSTLIANYADIMKSLEGMFVTDFTADEISNLVKMQLADMATWNVQSFAVTGTGDYQETYSWRGEELYVMWPNEATVNHAQALAQKVINGQILTEEDMKLPE